MNSMAILKYLVMDSVERSWIGHWQYVTCGVNFAEWGLTGRTLRTISLSGGRCNCYLKTWVSPRLSTTSCISISKCSEIREEEKGIKWGRLLPFPMHFPPRPNTKNHQWLETGMLYPRLWRSTWSHICSSHLICQLNQIALKRSKWRTDIDEEKRKQGIVLITCKNKNTFVLVSSIL